ncbi:relaxase/mobilization nuclease domain-containing protein [Tenacibaculum maritimum]|uniref:relaxase/mobilization nuclease domain-containing protein n=1 Tax=Tenacibaculum maritimum TaxID=107401 RepID=UPI00387600E6
MVIAKILPAKSGSFNGVGYNEEKLENDKAMLLEVNNFKGLDLHNSNKIDYVRYLQSQTKKNKRIKKPQFHATISAEKKNKSFEELQEFAKEYMQKLGYGDNPYLVYAHKDTENNHLHIVSTRVDNNGLKIDDSYEKMRSQGIVNEYYGLDYSKDIQKALSEINSYNIQTVAQYKMLLEREFKTKETEQQLIVYKSTFNKQIPKSRIEELIKAKGKFYKFNKIKDRKTELRDLIISLNKQVELKNLPILAKEHDFDIKFSYKKDSKEIFGYTVIDEKSKSVFKGSDIISLRNLKSLEEKISKESEIKLLINTEFKNRPGAIKDVNDFLKEKENIEVDFKGNVYDYDNESEKRGAKLDLNIDKETLNPFYYKSRLEFAQDFTIIYKQDKQILADLFKVNKTDLVYFEGTEKERLEQVEKRNQLNDYYNSTLDFIAKDSDNAKELLAESNIDIYKIGDNFFIADKDNNNIMHFDIKQHTKEVVLEKGLYTELKGDKGIVAEVKQGLIEKLANLLDEGFEDETTNSKGKKKKNKQQRSR